MPPMADSSPGWQRALLFLLPIVVSAASLPLLTTPSPVGTTAPADQFSSGRAMRHLRRIARSTHPVGSPAHAEVRRYLVQQLGKLELSPQIQQTIVGTTRSGWHRGAMVHNILARLPGTRSGKAVALVTHYDCVFNSRGAADAGAAVVALLETARALKSGPPLKNDLILLITDAEERGLLGATAFVEQHPWSRELGLVLNFEARGTGGPSAMFETSMGNGRLIEGLGRSDAPLFANSLISTLAKLLPNDTDMTIFKREGISGLNFAFADGLHRYHTPMDTIDNLEQGSLQHHGSHALSLARHFGNADLSQLTADDSIYFDVLGRLLISYGQSWSYLLCFAVLALFLLAMWTAVKQDRVSLGRVAGGFLITLMLLVLVVVGTLVLRWTIGLVRPGHLLLAYGKTFTVAQLMIVMGLCMMIHHWRSARSGANNILFGALSLWTLLTVAVTLLMPGGSYLFQWPLLFCLFGVLIRSSRLRGRLALFCLVSIPYTILLFSMLYAVLIMDGGSMPALPAVFAFLLWIPLIPHLTAIGPRLGRLLPPTLAGAGALLLACGLIVFDYGPRNPRPHWINYGLDADTGQAYWITGDSIDDSWIERLVPRSSSRGMLPRFFIKDNPRRYSRAPALNLSPPTITLNRQTREGATRVVDLHIRSPRGAPSFLMWEESGATIQSTFVAGRQLSQITRFSPQTDKKLSEALYGKSRSDWKLRFSGMDVDGVDVRLVVQGSRKLKLRIVDEAYGLPRSEEIQIAPRPETLMPYEWSDVTLVSKLYEI